MTIRRLFTKVERDSAQESLRQVFLALYYRHEFARRNEGVFKAGKKIAKALGLPEERLKTFVQKGEFLTDAIIRCVETAKTKTKRTRIEALKAYLKEYAVIPMVWDWDEKRPFFPIGYFDTIETKFTECHKAFKSLMGFEAYAMARLEIGHPVMFPVMPLRIQGKNKDKVVGNLDLGKYEAPMFLDFAAPKTACDSYLELMLMDHEVGLQRPTLSVKPVQEAPASLPDEESAGGQKKEYSIQRVKPGVLEKHLDVLDVARYWMHANRFYAKAKYYSEQTGAKKMQEKDAGEASRLIEAGKSSEALNEYQQDLLARALKINVWFSQKLKLAKPYEQGYRDII